MQPLVSVIMPVYNCELYIKEAVESILNQTFQDFELIIIDDCSSDSTLQICKSFVDNRIMIIEKDHNSGITNSLNFGLHTAKGKFIARMDGDDISMPTRFEKQVAFLDSNPEIILCGTSYIVIGQDQAYSLPQSHEAIKVNLLQANCIVHPSVMLRKDILIANNLSYDFKMEPAEDYDLWVRLAQVGKLHNLPECLLQYRVHDSQVSTIRNDKQIQVANQVRLKVLQLLCSQITFKEEVLYLKAMDCVKSLEFDEFKTLLNLKIKLLAVNNSAFITNLAIINYWNKVEREFISFYFKNRKTYNYVVLKRYVMICGELSFKLSFKETLVLCVKSLVNHKIK